MRARDFDRDEFLSKTWPEALESGEFEQATGGLVREDDDGNEGYCCLGVACELLTRMKLLRDRKWESDWYLPEKIAKLLGIEPTGKYRATKKDHTEHSLAADNDHGKSFKDIAKTIRKAHKRGLFEPVS